MLNKIKETAAKNISAISDKAVETSVSLKDKGEELTATVVQKTGDVSDVVKQKADDVTTTVKDSVKDLSAMNKLKEFTIASVNTVEDIDLELSKSNSSYEVNNFRVSGTAGVTAGMTLDIHFVKTQGAKEVSQKVSKYLIVKNPATGSTIQVPKVALVNKNTVKVKDPKTDEILTINAKTGEILAQ